MSVAENFVESEERSGDAPSRHIDLSTALLDRYARSWIDLQQTRKALAQRELPDEIVAEFKRLEDRVSWLLQRTLRQHALWPWLSHFPGLGGAHTALVIGRIGDPRRFPGQRCSEGHYLPPLHVVGDPCPVAVKFDELNATSGNGNEVTGTDDETVVGEEGYVCPGFMLPPREGTGVRSLWHWAGLHVEANGCAPRKRKGTKATWEPRVRASVMQPGGISEQIVRLDVPHYINVYRETKTRLSLRVVTFSESESTTGPHELGATEATCEHEAPAGRPLRPFEADRIARKVAAKAFLGDLIVEWKRSLA